MMKEDSLVQALAQALEPVVIKAVQNAMQEHRPEASDNDVILIDEAMKESRLVKPTIYRMTSPKWRAENPDKTPIPHFKRGNKLYFSRKAVRAWLMGQE